MTNNNEKHFAGVNQLSLRGIIIGVLGSCVITASSMYVALRISSLPWPTIFVAILSMAILKALGKTTFNEINITQTAMSAGAMVAGGLAFTLPGLWITGVWKDKTINTQHFLMVFFIGIAGMLLGTVLTYYLRPKFIEEQQLPYPIGTAAAETIQTGDEGSKKTVVLFSTMGLSAVFTYLRDNLGIIPASLSSKWLYARNINVGIWLSPMAIGIGYIIGALYTGVWFIGALISYLIIVPLGTYFKVFPNAAIAVSFKNTVGIGLMVGTGIGILISFIASIVKKNTNQIANTAKIDKNKSATSNIGKILVIFSVLAAFVLSIICGLNVAASILLILGVFITSAMAATITGQTGINPMEVFGIIVLLAIRIFIKIDTVSAFFIAACVAVSCGYAGDLLNEYKVGYKLGTNPKAQLISQIAGGLVGTVVAAAALFAIIGQFGGVGADKGLPAGQAYAVSQMVNGIGDPKVFMVAALLGVILYLVKIPSMTLGLGMYLSFEISAAVFLGGFIKYIVNRKDNSKDEIGNIAASGFLGGEGITGVAVAIIKMFAGS
ncbi:OPT/YSL family transporter [Clostridium oryzae]|uniref:OPT oligopeptide transporter protein n=1 Tax=Clostridium oryzae TaxID=1450648 RepID=A0A1V4IP42_9CLOT|nr:OPT/YSL family transporter [Clostridium oryzae]OPJ61686.1 OPT oligopeptide transporter protein [Clostridium oryzae]